MNIGILGYGKMGRAVEKEAEKHAWPVTFIRDLFHERGDIDSSDVLIDFSTGSCALEHIELATVHKKSLVIGSTNWVVDQEQVNRITENRIAVLFGANFSLGMALLSTALTSVLAMVRGLTGYDVAIFEEHHCQKADAPSGSAKALAKIILDGLPQKRGVIEHLGEGPIDREMLQIASLRVGSIFGTHTIRFDSDHDSLSLIHQAKDRSGFAAGALLAGEWLSDKIGFYLFNEILPTILAEKESERLKGE